MKYFIILLACFQIIPCLAQDNKSQSNWGAMLGLTFSVGTSKRHIGVVLGGYYFYDWIQVNTRISTQYNFINLGPPLKGAELQASIGILAAFGKRDTLKNRFLSPLNNQTGKKYSLAYAYNIYLDKIRTSQRTGAIAIQIGRFQMSVENDILGGRGSDKFRTGAFLLAYRMNHTQIGINTVFWTGDPSRNAKFVEESDYPSRFGYKDMSASPYGKFSHGILSFQVQHILPFNQQLQLNMGIDSEHVRHAVQNVFIHDMYFFPAKWNKARNPHYPMLDINGMPYLFDSQQEIKHTSPYLQVSMNPHIFY